ncbi:MAG: hypothetical protein CMM56_02455 [Rhodospirillaceae bacterium]|nr:hypothetical protein [Rhodospirillaceae bacterium]|tara:strand:- start:33 stop:227 length:195 start_codon:yes stop_codon:yes gene_type:complete
MNFPCLIVKALFLFLLSACSGTEISTVPSIDDLGLEEPKDFPLGESPEMLFAILDQGNKKTKNF